MSATILRQDGSVLLWSGVFRDPRKIGYLDLEGDDPSIGQWRARTVEGSSLGVYPTYNAARKALLRQGGAR